MSIDISGIDKVELVKALYDRAKALGMGFLQAVDGPLSDEEAAHLAKGHMDYVHGKAMKVFVADDTMRGDLYDRDNGHGAAQHVVDELRSAQE